MGQYDWSTVVTTSVSNTSGDKTAVTVNCYFQNNNWNYVMYMTAWVTCNGEEVKVMNRKNIDTTDVSRNGGRVFLGSHTFYFDRSGSAFNVSCSARIMSDGGYADGNKRSSSTSVSIPARVYNKHGNPTIKASKSTVNYSEKVTISWGKSGTQGNANFERFELYQGNTKLYSGSGTSYTVTPSSVTGAKGGTATYKVREIHEWYGSYPSTEASVSVEVRSGVVTAYNSSGQKKTGLVTAYDSNGKSHYVLITAYDSSGKKHSVV